MPAAEVYTLLYKKEDAHEDPIYSCCWTKTRLTDEPKDFIVTAGLDGLIKIWTLIDNRLELVHTLDGHTMAIVSLAVSPDGHTLATSSLDSALTIWDLVTGQKVHDIPTAATDVWNVVFSPDGKQLVTGSHTGKVVIYDVAKGIQVKVLDTRGKFTLSVDWSADGKYICSGSVDGAVCIFDVAQGKLIHTVEAHVRSIRTVAFSPNSKLIVTASDDGNIKTIDVVSGWLVDSLQHGTWAVAARFSGDGARVVTAAVDGTVRVATTDPLALQYTYSEHHDRVWGVNFNVEGNKIVSVSQDRCINIYECPLPPQHSKH